jgi:hypothetical protein
MSFDEVFENFSNWIKEIDSTNPDTENVKAYNFGLFESEKGYSVYLTGSNQYDEDDDDWACNEDFVPNQKYFELPDYFIEGKNWDKIQRDFAEVIRKFIESDSFRNSFLAKAEAITVGFDDGDLERVF